MRFGTHLGTEQSAMAKLENKVKENPKLEQNMLSDGKISLFLEYYLGREETPVLDEHGNPSYMRRERWLESQKYTLSIIGGRRICSYI